MNKQIPSYLKLVTDTITETPAAAAEDLAALEHVCQAFEQATGWRLEFAAGPIPSANIEPDVVRPGQSGRRSLSRAHQASFH